MFFNKTKNSRVNSDTGIFNQQESSKKEVSVAFSVKDIHNAFMSASDKALTEAKKILGSSVVEKSRRLENLGFIGTPAYKEGYKEKLRIQKAEELELLLSEYSFRYPQYKFIRQEDVNVLCKKYDLVCGDVYNYQMDIPEKNIQEMENFKLKKEDYLRQRQNVMLGTFGTSGFSSGSYYEMLNDFYKKLEERRGKEEKTQNQIQNDDGTISYKPPFKICAPLSHFNTENQKLVGNMLVHKDPIVLQPVFKGYLIVTAWGDEASDEIVINPNKN